MCTALSAASSGTPVKYHGVYGDHNLAVSLSEVESRFSQEEGVDTAGVALRSSQCTAHNLGRDFELLVNQCLECSKQPEADADRRRTPDGDTGDLWRENMVVVTSISLGEEDSRKDVDTEDEGATEDITDGTLISFDFSHVPQDSTMATEKGGEDELNWEDQPGENVIEDSPSTTDITVKEDVCDVNIKVEDDAEWPALGCSCENPTRIKSSSEREKMEQAKRPKTKRLKKWKAISQNELGFNYSVLTVQQYRGVSGEEDMEQELLKFEKLLADSQQELDVTGVKVGFSAKTEAETESKKEAKPATKRKSKKLRRRQNILKQAVSDMKLHYDLCVAADEKDWLIDELEADVLKLLSVKGSSSVPLHLRRNHKWRRMKTRKLVKMKVWRSSRHSHGQNVHVSHHIHKKLTASGYVQFHAPHYLPKPKPRSGLKDLPEPQSYHPPPVHQAIVKPCERKPPPAPRHALNNNNADAAIPADILNVLMALQDRDLTPEDYEILLRLDERVKPKTLQKDVLESFRTEAVTSEVVASHPEPCTVCMEPYSEGQIRKYLPCEHAFHSSCIDTWLNNSSMNCPLDGLPVDER